MKEGDIVWVRPGLGDHEEPAVILKLSCHYHNPYARSESEESNDDSNINSSDTTITTEREHENEHENKKGILVRYNVSLVEAVVSTNNVRNMSPSNNNNQNGSTAATAAGGVRRRSTRNRKATDTYNPSSSSSTTTTAAAAASTTRKAKISSTLKIETNTTTTTNDDDDDDDDSNNNITLSKLHSNSKNKPKRKNNSNSNSKKRKLKMMDDNTLDVKNENEDETVVLQSSTTPVAKKQRKKKKKIKIEIEEETKEDEIPNSSIETKEENNATTTTTTTETTTLTTPTNSTIQLTKTTSPYFDPQVDNSDEENEVTTANITTTKSAKRKAKTTTTTTTTTTKTKTKTATKATKGKKPITKSRKVTVKKVTSTAAAKKSTTKSPTTTTATKKTTKAAAKKKSTEMEKKIVTLKDVVVNKNKNKNHLAGKPDGNGGLNDSPSNYTIEYAKTGRSTCKRCDLKIQKNDIRVGHRPLFRGRPGFRIYKHLHCIVFSDEVDFASDVHGYDDLNTLVEEGDGGEGGEGDDNDNDNDSNGMSDYDKLVARIEESKKERNVENEELHPDELVEKEFSGELRDSPKGLNAKLLPFQKEGVSWMYCQEVNVTDLRGGILADEMGMGKTLQTITTMLDNRPKLQHSLPGAKHPPSCTEELKETLDKEEQLWEKSLNEWQHEMKMNDVPDSVIPKSMGGKAKGKGNGSSSSSSRAGTLVICPVIALTQWKNEIEKFCERNALTICTYHGPDRAKTVPREMMRKYDVVLTTYQVIEHDFRKMVSPNKVKCPNCGKKFKVDKLRVHLKYFCGEGAQRTEAQSRTRRGGNRRGNPPSQGNNMGSGEDDNDDGKDKGKKKMMKSKNEKKPVKKNVKKVFKKVKDDTDYDSESDLSIQSEPSKIVSKARTPRAAAVKAKTRVTATTKKEVSSDEEYKESDGDYDDDKEEIQSSSSDSSSEDNLPIKRARNRQAKALKNAKKGKGSGKKTEKKKFSKKSQNKKETGKKQFKSGKKGQKKDESSSSEENSSSEDDSDIDPFDDVDMDALIAEAMAGAQMSITHTLCWWRIVLDEAHFIKSRSSQTSAAAFALTGIHRWCLSGTPLQNRVGEFYSLVRFLRLDPMAHYFCRAKDCTCKQVHYRMFNGRCKDCGHSSIQHYSYFNRKVLNPIQRDGYANDGRKAMFTLKNEVLDRCLLRRTKETRAEDMNLPPRIVTIKTIKLHPIEEDFYNAVFTRTTSSFNDYVEEGTLLNNYAHIFDLLMRMRQSVCHPYLVVYSKKDMARRAASAPAVANGSVDCDLCHETPTERVVSTCCQAAFCKSCVLEYMETAAGIGGNNGMPCPSCRNPFTIDLSQVQEDDIDDSTLSIPNKEKISRFGLPSLQELPHVATGSILRRIDLCEFATSSKIEALTMELVEMRKNSPGSKAIVFSQFVNMLDLIRWRLHSDPYLTEMGLGVRAIHGGMDVKSRDAALKDFREDHNVRVLIMSLKAGGVALNLTVANYIYLMDPWWNPAAEMQAIDRTHRLGQYRPIRAVRFIAENTVEERILQLQEKKRLVFDGTVGRDAGSLKMLTVDDMKSLFG